MVLFRHISANVVHHIKCCGFIYCETVKHALGGHVLFTKPSYDVSHLETVNQNSSLGMA